MARLFKHDFRVAASFLLSLGLTLPLHPSAFVAYATEDYGNTNIEASANQDEEDFGETLIAAESDIANWEDAQSQTEGEASSETALIDEVVANMTLDEKISQMIMPCFLTWDGKDATDLSESPTLANALKRHQYCGVALYASNLQSTAQTVRLISDLQKNNSQGDFSYKVPYLVASNHEDESLTRLPMGLQSTNYMAIGATQNSELNATRAGQVLGQELSSLGINVDFGPSIVVATEPTDTKNKLVFSEDASKAGTLAVALKNGVAESGVISGYKNFPATGGNNQSPTVIHTSLEQLKRDELAAYKEVVNKGADLIVASSATFAELDTSAELTNGKTGHYPAAMSANIIDGMLRNELGFNGVVATDSLRSARFKSEPNTSNALVTGNAGKGDETPSIEYAANVAERCINAGCDILLTPADLNNDAASTYYDNYIEAIAKKVDNGIPAQTIDNSVRRILELKQKHGILDLDVAANDIVQSAEAAEKTVGSPAHRQTELDIARESITVLKNNDSTLPLTTTSKRVVILSQLKSHSAKVAKSIAMLQSEGIIDKDANISDLAMGSTSGSSDARTSITLDYYVEDDSTSHYGYDTKAAIAEADVVICFSNVSGIEDVQPSSVCDQTIADVMFDSEVGGAKFVLVSNGQSYDTVRYADAEAIVVSYMDTRASAESTTNKANRTEDYNASSIAVLECIFGKVAPKGRLSAHIPALHEGLTGRISIEQDSCAYEPGAGISWS